MATHNTKRGLQGSERECSGTQEGNQEKEHSRSQGGERTVHCCHRDGSEVGARGQSSGEAVSDSGEQLGRQKGKDGFAPQPMGEEETEALSADYPANFVSVGEKREQSRRVGFVLGERHLFGLGFILFDFKHTVSERGFGPRAERGSAGRGWGYREGIRNIGKTPGGSDGCSHPGQEEKRGRAVGADAFLGRGPS